MKTILRAVGVVLDVVDAAVVVGLTVVVAVTHVVIDVLVVAGSSCSQ